MTPVKDATNKKGELLQLRVDKPFLDRLNAAAERHYMPLSVLLRSWLSERLREEDRLANIKRIEWEKDRFQCIEGIIANGFEPGPVLVAHAYALASDAKIDMDRVQEDSHLLVPLFYRTPATGRIHQYGYEVTRAYKDGVVVAKGQALKSGELEAILSIPTDRDQILGMQLDLGIVETIRSLGSFLRNKEIALPYLFKISLLRIKNHVLTDHFILASTHELPTLKDEKITLSEIMITNFDQLASDASTGEHIIAVLDELWNASGQPYSQSFNDAKKWVEHK